MNHASTPLDVRVLPAAIGTWAVALCAIASRGLAIGVMTLIAVATVAALTLAPKDRARHRAAWVGWARHTLAFGALVTVVAGGCVTGVVAARETAIKDLLAGASARVGATVILTSDAKQGRKSVGVNGTVVSLGGEGQAARLPSRKIPVYALEVDPTWRAGQVVTITGRVWQGSGQRLMLQTTAGEVLAEPTGISAGVDRLREGIRRASAGLPPQARGLVPGVTIGDDRRLPQEIQQAMRDTSLSHLTAVSGTHIGVVLGTVLIVSARAPTWARALLGGATLIAMVAVVLPTASVLRAGGMGLFTLAALLTRRPRTGVPVLAVTVIVLVVLDPWLATNIGFALSSAATLGLLLWAAPLGQALGGTHLARACAVPIAAQAWCGPLLLGLEDGISLYAVPANLLAVPALAPATILGIAGAILSPAAPALAGAFAHIASCFTGWIAAVAVVFARLPGARLPWLHGPAGMGLLTLVTGLAAYGVHRRLRYRRADVLRTWQA